jgi:Zn-dependent metalloprotease
MTCRFLPPYLLERLAAAHVDDHVCRCGRHTLTVDESLRSRRLSPPRVAGAPAGELRAATDDPFAVHSAGNTATLPGTLVRAYGDPPSGDTAVDEAYAGVEAVLALFAEVYDRASYDGHGAPVLATVHYEQGYDNAFWDGHQLVFGDGDGRVFDRFTEPVEVLGHEFTHAVTQYIAGLVYADQPGALNESLSDVFASCLKQRLSGQTAAEADWLIGAGLFLPGVHARALRSMAEPGTAYDDPVLGRDPQVGSMADYVHSDRDNGGVHLNSGIPNRAFALASLEIGGFAWEHAGRVWYDVLTSGRLRPTANFREFASETVRVSVERFGRASTEARAIMGGWSAVGIEVPPTA